MNESKSVNETMQKLLVAIKWVGTCLQNEICTVPMACRLTPIIYLFDDRGLLTDSGLPLTCLNAHCLDHISEE